MAENPGSYEPTEDPIQVEVPPVRSLDEPDGSFEEAESGASLERLRLWSVTDEDVHVTGTLVWYYAICKREAWLMAHQITPDEDDSNIEFGRFLHRQRYQRERKEEPISGGKIDFIKMATGSLLVAEVKKSSKYENASRMQILFYLHKLNEQGVTANGEIRIPEEKKKIPVELSVQARAEIQSLEAEILRLMKDAAPPAPDKTRWCKNCGYRDFCWS